MKRTIYIAFALLILASCEKEDGSYNFSENFAPGYDNPFIAEQYNEFEDNPFIDVSEQDVSTFSIDADGGSYANVRRYIEYGQLPPKAAVRIEELINNFPMDYGEPDEHPVFVDGEVFGCPWESSHKLIRIGLKGKTIQRSELPASNIVLLLDVSGSMSAENKLPLLVEAMKLFVNEMSQNDKISIVTYAGADEVVLEGTNGAEKQNIYAALNSLSSGGSTAGAQGIITAYEIALENFVNGGNNRIVLATDGDFNVGPSTQGELIDLIEEKREQGVFLTVIGMGTGNLNEAMMEQLANNGNGTYEYLDNMTQAKKLFVDEYSKFFTVAKDVKVQVKFYADYVKQYRLIGYENRVLDNDDFDDDTKDAGEIGSGQSVTALYEIVPVETNNKARRTFNIDFRYKMPDGDKSNLINLDVNDYGNSYTEASENARFASAVASFGMILRDSPYKRETSFEQVKQWVEAAHSFDPYNYRNDFIGLIDKAKNINQ